VDKTGLLLKCGDGYWQVRADRAISLAIAQSFDPKQPNHFGAPLASTAAWETDGFVGDTHRGGSCNVHRVNMIPHCNGTHTETVSHIIDRMVPLAGCLANGPVLASLVSVTPVLFSESGEQYDPAADNGDLVITAASIRAATERLFAAMDLRNAPALVIRTLPNDPAKRSRVYSFENPPPFLTNDAMQYVFSQGIEHLLVDLPSVDRMSDRGRMSNHCIFWNVDPENRKQRDSNLTGKTISEMLFIPDSVADSVGLLDIQFAPFESDAAPSRPVWFPLEPAARPG